MPVARDTGTLKAAKAAYQSMSTTPSASSMTEAQLFADPNNLFGDPLLTLAESHNDKTIADRVNSNGNATQHTVSVNAIDQRIKAALKARAKTTNSDYATMKALHDQLRFGNGVKSAHRTSMGKRNQLIQAAAKVMSSTPESATAVDDEDWKDGEDNGEGLEKGNLENEEVDGDAPEVKLDKSADATLDEVKPVPKDSKDGDSAE